MPRVLYSIVGGTACSPGEVLTQGDAPVWPLVDEEDLSALYRLTALFGCELSVAKSARFGPGIAGVECVAWASAEVEHFARLYAHLTGRAAAHSTDGGMAGRPDVLVALFEDITPALLDGIDIDDGRPATGLIIAPTLETLRRAFCLAPQPPRRKLKAHR